jgi:hypothetical protein
MWMISPSMLCRKHLLGEHGEIHKHRHNFVKRHNMNGRKGQIFPSLMGARHEELVEEMIRRGYNHASPYDQPDVDYLGDFPPPDIEANKKDLCGRCEECNKNIRGIE